MRKYILTLLAVFLLGGSALGGRYDLLDRDELLSSNSELVSDEAADFVNGNYSLTVNTSIHYDSGTGLYTYFFRIRTDARQSFVSLNLFGNWADNEPLNWGIVSDESQGVESVSLIHSESGLNLTVQFGGASAAQSSENTVTVYIQSPNAPGIFTGFVTDEWTLAPRGTVPEPSTLFLLGSGLAGALGFFRKKYKAQT